jgi:type III restriction enzyme
MSGYEVPNPIVNSPFREPAEHCNIVAGEEPARLSGRRPAMYFYRDPAAKPDSFGREAGTASELKPVNRVRQQVKALRDQGYPGASRATLDLVQWWRRGLLDHRRLIAGRGGGRRITRLIVLC